MSSTLSADYLRLDVRPSRRLLILFIALYAIAAASVLILDVAWYWRAGLLCALLFSATQVLRRYIFLNDPCAIVHMHCTEGQWWLGLRGSQQDRDATLTAASIWMFGIIVLQFTVQSGQRLSVLLAQDQADADSLRRLRVYILNRLPAG
jgi:hypothetical protein